MVNIKIISNKLKSEISSKEFRMSLYVEIFALIGILIIIALQSYYSPDVTIDTILSFFGFLIIFFLPGYFTYRELKQKNIKNKFTIIFFCYTFMTGGIMIASMAETQYGDVIPSLVIDTNYALFPEIDFSLLGFYAVILPFQVIYSKYSYRLVVLAAIVGSSPGTTAKDDKFPY